MIELAGLRINNPQAVLAGYGLLRVLNQAGYEVSLEWRKSDWQAILHGMDWAELITCLTKYLQQREQAPELNWTDSIKDFPRDRYRELMQTATAEERSWLEAYWHEVPSRRSGRDITLAETQLDMTGGPVKLFAAVREIIIWLRQKKIVQPLEKALLLPWVNDDDCSSLGWDLGAYRNGVSITGGKAPEKLPKRTVAAATWLAFEALPWFPSRWLSGRRDEVIWVLPHHPVTAATVQAILLAHPAMPPEELTAQDWSSWTAKIGRNGKYGYLLPATRQA